MTAIYTTDPLAESQRLIAVLERNLALVPFAAEQLAVHRSVQTMLIACQQRSDAAVSAWRSALARRWECEIAARRLYKQVQRQYIALYGSAEHPEVQRIASSYDDANTSPKSLLTDLQRVLLDLRVRRDTLVAERQSELQHTCDELDTAIHEAEHCEAARRTAVLERRMAQEAFRRARTATQDAFNTHYGTQLAPGLNELFA